MYDDIGSFAAVPSNLPAILADKGIKTLVFNPITPILTTIQNNRDHRKIISIDGKTAFSGGINVGDEYVNWVEKYGHWKDCGVMLQGKAAWGLTCVYLEMWQVQLCLRKRPFHWEYGTLYPWKETTCAVESDGWVQPYADSPLDNDNVGEHVYIQIINNARNYVYINTPYLIVDDNMQSALTLAAKSGVDVRIVTPHRPDKKPVHMVTRSYYRLLIESGVRIYEYTRGFNHAKTFVSDDSVATVGTTNLDFRSLYLHFECGVWMYKSSCVAAVKDDFLKTLDECEEITLEKARGNWLTRTVREVLRVFAPLM
jgi:cardiolipin synthase